MYKAIIVDDEKKIRDGLKKLINWEEHGFIIVGQAGDGVEALELYARTKPSLVVTDIKMPRMDGLELACELKKTNPDISIIILSGYNDFNYAKQAIKANVSNYLMKPVNVDELCGELDSIRDKITSRLSLESKNKQDDENIKNMLLVKLINGDLTEEEAMKTALAHNIKLHCAKSLCVCIVDIPTLLKGQSSLSKSDIQLKKFIVNNIMEELLGSKPSRYCCEYSKGRYCILAASADAELKAELLVDEMHTVAGSLKEFCDPDVTIAVGSIVGSASRLTESYKSAAALFDLKLGAAGNEKVLYAACSDSSTDIIKILRYIHRHYHEELSLKKLAEVFYISPSYLGQLLIKETGEYFNDLLNKTRVENAKKLLQENIYSIQKISELVGYKNVEHFYKNFKNITGINPANYKKHSG